MFVYFIQQGADGPIKIGKAERPDRRLVALQIGNPHQLAIRGICGGGHAGERHIQKHFAEERLSREWFRPSPRLERFVSKLPTWEAVQAGAACPSVIGFRDRAVCRLYEEGYTHRDIGEVFGFSHQRCQQIVALYEDGELKGRFSRGRRDKPDEPIQAAYDRLMSEYSDDVALLLDDER